MGRPASLRAHGLMGSWAHGPGSQAQLGRWRRVCCAQLTTTTWRYLGAGVDDWPCQGSRSVAPHLWECAAASISAARKCALARRQADRLCSRRPPLGGSSGAGRRLLTWPTKGEPENITHTRPLRPVLLLRLVRLAIAPLAWRLAPAARPGAR